MASCFAPVSFRNSSKNVLRPVYFVRNEPSRKHKPSSFVTSSVEHPKYLRYKLAEVEAAARAARSTHGHGRSSGAGGGAASGDNIHDVEFEDESAGGVRLRPATTASESVEQVIEDERDIRQASASAASVSSQVVSEADLAKRQAEVLALAQYFPEPVSTALIELASSKEPLLPTDNVSLRNVEALTDSPLMQPTPGNIEQQRQYDQLKSEQSRAKLFFNKEITAASAADAREAAQSSSASAALAASAAASASSSLRQSSPVESELPPPQKRPRNAPSSSQSTSAAAAASAETPEDLEVQKRRWRDPNYLAGLEAKFRYPAVPLSASVESVRPVEEEKRYSAQELRRLTKAGFDIQYPYSKRQLQELQLVPFQDEEERQRRNAELLRQKADELALRREEEELADSPTRRFVAAAKRRVTNFARSLSSRFTPKKKEATKRRFEESQGGEVAQSAPATSAINTYEVEFVYSEPDSLKLLQLLELPNKVTRKEYEKRYREARQDLHPDKLTFFVTQVAKPPGSEDTEESKKLQSIGDDLVQKKYREIDRLADTFDKEYKKLAAIYELSKLPRAQRLWKWIYDYAATFTLLDVVVRLIPTYYYWKYAPSAANANAIFSALQWLLATFSRWVIEKMSEWSLARMDRFIDFCRSKMIEYTDRLPPEERSYRRRVIDGFLVLLRQLSPEAPPLPVTLPQTPSNVPKWTVRNFIKYSWIALLQLPLVDRYVIELLTQYGVVPVVGTAAAAAVGYGLYTYSRSSNVAEKPAVNVKRGESSKAVDVDLESGRPEATSRSTSTLMEIETSLQGDVSSSSAGPASDLVLLEDLTSTRMKLEAALKKAEEDAEKATSNAKIQMNDYKLARILLEQSRERKNALSKERALIVLEKEKEEAGVEEVRKRTKEAVEKAEKAQRKLDAAVIKQTDAGRALSLVKLRASTVSFAKVPEGATPEQARSIAQQAEAVVQSQQKALSLYELATAELEAARQEAEVTHRAAREAEAASLNAIAEAEGKVEQVKKRLAENDENAESTQTFIQRAQKIDATRKEQKELSIALEKEAKEKVRVLSQRLDEIIKQLAEVRRRSTGLAKASIATALRRRAAGFIATLNEIAPQLEDAIRAYKLYLEMRAAETTRDGKQKIDEKILRISARLEEQQVDEALKAYKMLTELGLSQQTTEAEKKRINETLQRITRFVEELRALKSQADKARSELNSGSGRQRTRHYASRRHQYVTKKYNYA